MMSFEKMRELAKARAEEIPDSPDLPALSAEQAAITAALTEGQEQAIADGPGA
jgi:hypothetical protein